MMGIGALLLFRKLFGRLPLESTIWNYAHCLSDTIFLFPLDSNPLSVEEMDNFDGGKNDKRVKKKREKKK